MFCSEERRKKYFNEERGKVIFKKEKAYLNIRYAF
jgi:hypothetical protein